MTAIVWSQTNCAWCDRAKMLLNSYSIKYEERLIGEQWTKQDLLAAVPSARSVPQIFLDEEYVGGFTELKHKLGELN
jgi:glutaredoxin 3